MKQIDTIVFDIGNVLAEFGWRPLLKRLDYDEEMITALGKAVFLHPVWGEFDRGVLSDDEIFTAFCRSAPSLSAAIANIRAHLPELVWEYDWSAPWLCDLKRRGYRVLLLSNYGHTLFAYAKAHFKFLKLVDGAVISCDWQHIKPEPELYQALIDTYAVHPEHAVFLDDLEQNCAGASVFGFHTIQVQTHQQAVADLEQLLKG